MITGFQTVDEYLLNTEKDKHVILINSYGDIIAGGTAENLLTNIRHSLIKLAFVTGVSETSDSTILNVKLQ